MTVEEMKTRLQSELPELLKQDRGFRQWLEQLIRQTALTPESFDARFERILQQFAADRAEWRSEWQEWRQEQDRKREENDRKWEENTRQWQEHRQEWREWIAKFDAKAEEDRLKWEEQKRKWDENNEKWREQNRKWDEDNEKWHEQNRKWDEQNRKNNELLEEIKKSRSRQEQGIGALGARWGIASEHSFRAALKGILETSFGVEVLNINEFDDQGMVFGAPDQVEIDIIIKNGTLILCELKSSMSRSDMYIFDRKVRFYEQRHQRQVQRKIVVSPMVPPAVRDLAEHLNIEVFGYAEDVATS
ncbi:MAG: DUF3782 domain-containing protein [Gammaproteobacteria bacterium]|nr:DUF3782 domain-containing protein [Gammaproteobacteria bacterium]